MWKYKIRPHHGLCIHFFEGKGYSKQFVENMEWIIEQGKQSENALTFAVTYGVDSLCEACPNNSGAMCTSQQKVEVLDQLVVEQCGLTQGMELTLEELLKRVEENILNTGKFHQICSNCVWYEEICAKKY